MESREIIDDKKNLKAIIHKRISGGYWFEYVEKIVCLNHDLKYVKKLSSNGNYLLRMQCENCGESVSNGMKHSLVENVNDLPLFNDSLNDKTWEFRQDISYQLINGRQEDIYNQYLNYLKSDKWNLKRSKVLKRDNYLCQACLTNKATQVHHLTYENLYDEPLFELISVCYRCHDKIESKKQHKK